MDMDSYKNTLHHVILILDKNENLLTINKQNTDVDGTLICVYKK